MAVKVRQHRGAWWVFVDHKGQRKAKRVGEGRAGKHAAELAAAKIAARLAEGGPLVVPAPAAVPPFEDAARAWLARYRTLFAVRPGTLAYRTIFLEKHVIPHFAGCLASDVTPERVEDFIAAKRAPGGALRGKALADSTLKVNLPTLRMLLDSFVRRGWLAANPLRGEALWRPTPQSDEPDPFTQPELAALVTAAEAIDPRWGLMVRCWAQSGMRSGELRGLRYEDLDPQAGRVAIQRTRTRSVTGPAKTARSVRLAALTHPTCEASARVAGGGDAGEPRGAGPARPVRAARSERATVPEPQAPRAADGGARAAHALASHRGPRPGAPPAPGDVAALLHLEPALPRRPAPGRGRADGPLAPRDARLLRAVSGAAGATARNPAATGGDQGLT